MKPSSRNDCSLVLLAVAFVMVIGLTAVSSGQEIPAQSAALIDDWTHHHLVFSNPGREADAIKNGRYEHWYNITHDPRYQLQQLKRRHSQPAVASTTPPAPADFSSRLAAAMAAKSASKPKGNPISKDWSVALGGPSATGTVNSNNGSSSSSVTIGSTTLTASAPTDEVATLTFGSTAPAAGSTVTFGGIAYTFSTSLIASAPSSGCTVYSAAGSTGAINLQYAISNPNSHAGSTTFRCASGVGANSVATSSRSSAKITLTAVIPGSSGFSVTLSTTPSTNITLGGTMGSDGATNGTTWAYWSGANYLTPALVAVNIVYTINNNSTLATEVSAAANGSTISVTPLTGGSSGGYALAAANFNLTWNPQGTVQPNAFPAMYGASSTSASCADFIIYPTGTTGTSSAASIVAYDNLYSSCSSSGPVPSVSWAYNTGGAVTTSPALSLDGSQVAYVQSNGTTASLVLLKWVPNSGTLTAPGSITQETASNYQACTAPCYASLPLSGSHNDTFSAPFIDYNNDTIYVGDDSGYLHQFFGVFNGNPAENTATPWPVHLGTNKLSSPVYDPESGFQGGYIFVGDLGGVFYSVCGPYGYQCGTSGQIHGNTGSLGDAIADAPLVNSGDGTVFVFVTTDGSSMPYSGDNAVWEFVSSFTDYGSPGVVYAGKGGTGYYLYAGAPDNVYYDSGNPASGNIYVVGNTGAAGGATLYQVKVAYSSLTGAVNTIATGLNSTGYPWPSPVTEFCNNGANPCSLSQRTATGSLSTISPNVILTSGAFTSADVGAQIWASPSNALYGATITAVLSPNTANLEFGAPANEAGQTFTIQDGVTTSGKDYIFFSVNRGTGSGCTNAAGNGCVLAYNVTNPTSISQAGSGLNVKTPSGSSGCWATGGIVIDNSATSSGASQIYFLNLNGIAAGGPVAGSKTSGNCNNGTATNVIDAVQASQSSP